MAQFTKINENATEIWEILQQLRQRMLTVQSLADDWANEVGSRTLAKIVSDEIFCHSYGFDDWVDRIGELLCSNDFDD